jgi:hypothetical protein
MSRRPSLSAALVAAFAAAFTLVAASHLEAQSSTVRVTIAGGPHAGTYEMKDVCDASGTWYPSMSMMAWATTAIGPNALKSIEFFTASVKGKPDGFALVVTMQPQGKQVAYEIYAIPPEMHPPGRTLPVKGRGSVTVQQTATGETATFRGVTADGVRMEGSVDCRKP